MIRILVALSVLLVAYWALVLWRRPPRRLAGASLGGVGIREAAVVQFTTRTCGPCRAAVTQLREAAELAGVVYRQIDVGDRPDVARRLGIRTVPTVVVTDGDGRVRRTWTEVPDHRELASATGRGPGRASP